MMFSSKVEINNVHEITRSNLSFSIVLWYFCVVVVVSNVIFTFIYQHNETK
jgi:hypothetical protein